MIKFLDKDFDVTKYDAVAINPLQSWEWGEIREKNGNKILRIGEYFEEKLVNVFLISLHKIPLLNYYIGYCPRSVIPSVDVCEFIKKHCLDNKIITVKFEPYEKFNEQKIDYLKKSSFQLFPDWTQVLDLKKTDEELLKNLKSKTRYNLKLAQKKGLKVIEKTDDEGFKIFSKLYFETCKRQKYLGHNQNYHRIIFEHLKKHISHILIVYYENTPLGAYELFLFNKNLYYVYGGSSNEFRNYMGTNLLMWEAINFGKKNGAERFDMWGSLSPNFDEKDPWAGFTKFKEGYGTEYVQFVGSYDLVVNPILYSAYTTIYKLREFILVNLQ
jgi:lipid II:glycine glycyltransferase (peptidoglycan interpeptide bridge formation enzyme)